MAKQKFYVVWNGVEDGVYTSWEACQQAVSGFSDAKYKAFKTEAEAEEAFEMGWEEYKKVEESQNSKPSTPNANPSTPSPKPFTLPPAAINESIAVDAACSGNPGPMEYQAIDLATGARVFHFGPMKGTNNIGEFLAIVHALALMQQQGLYDKTIYSDSYNAILWVNKRKCKTKLERTPETEELYQIILRAERWLQTHQWHNPIVKWETQKWGEVPADFGRKK